MGRGLSPLQKWMLYAALDNRRKENRDDDSGAADLPLREIKTGYFKLAPASRSHAKAIEYLHRELACGKRAPKGFHRADCACEAHDDVPDECSEPDPLGPNATPEDRLHWRLRLTFNDKNPAINASITRAVRRLQ